MLEDIRFPLMTVVTMLCKCCFQQHHHKLMQEQGLSTAMILSIFDGVSLQLDNSFTQQAVTVFSDS